jgi:hypothetical protein
MHWFNRNQNVWRVTILLILVISILGPWTHTSDGVPPPAWCRAPHILLETSRCARLMPGIEIITFGGRALLSILVGLGSGQLAGLNLVRELSFTLLISSLVLPLIVLPLQVRFGGNRYLQIGALAAWGLAAVIGLFIGATGGIIPPGQNWGLWLFISAAAGALTLEATLFRAEKN